MEAFQEKRSPIRIDWEFNFKSAALNLRNRHLFFHNNFK